MRILHRRCAGLDVHKKTISVCVRHRVHSHKVETEAAVFGTSTPDLEQMRDWLKERKVRHLALESTGVFWRPVWNVLESARWKFEMLLVNPQHVRAIPGKKTDQKDADRLAELLQYGLMRGSYVPPPEIRQLRDLTRGRVALQKERNRTINRIRKLLETVNVKLGSVISDIVGQSGMAILQAMAAGQTDPEKLAQNTTGKLKASPEELSRVLKGRYNDHFRWLLSQQLEQVGYLNDRVDQLEKQLAEQIKPYRDIVVRLCTIPGVDIVTACAMLAELGPDMGVFADGAHVASWAGLCPGNNESAGKRLSGRTRKGNRYLRSLLVQNAWAVSHKKDCYLSAVFGRVSGRRGGKKAAVAVAHKILVISYHIIRDGSEYHEPGGDYFDLRDPAKTVKMLSKRLERFGFKVVADDRRAIGRTVASKAHVRRAPISLEQAGGCARCAKWGLPCIHARNSRALRTEDEDLSRSQQ